MTMCPLCGASLETIHDEIRLSCSCDPVAVMRKVGAGFPTDEQDWIRSAKIAQAGFWDVWENGMGP